MTIKLPRRSTFAPIAGDQPWAPTFALDWEDLLVALEGALNTIADQEALITSQQAALAEQLQMIQNNAGAVAAVGTVANNSGSTGTGKHLSAYNSATVSSSSWVTVASVTFSSAVAASSVSLAATGPTSGSSAYNSHVTTTQNGDVQVLKNGSAVTSANPYTVDSDGNLTFTPFAALGADATTGTITYALQVRKTAGTSADLAFVLDVTRN